VLLTAALLVSAFAQASSDADLSKFIVGQWKFKDASCLSGALPHWEEPIQTYEYTIGFDAQSNVHIQEYHDGHLATDGLGRYSIQDAVLSFDSVRYCHYYPDSTECSVRAQSTSLISVQGSQLWLLQNEGDDNGVCPARDVMIAQYDRR